MEKFYSIFLFVLIILFSVNANATLIVDTGQPVGQIGSTLTSSQWLAAEFTTSQDYLINGIWGWIDGQSGEGPAGGTATAAIYADDYVGNDAQNQPATGEIPGTELFSSSFTASAAENWYGSSGLNQFLPAGTYWVAYEVRSGQTLSGRMPYGAPDPLVEKFAFTLGAGNWSKSIGSKTYGIRIDATAPVPEPATMLLFGTGLAGLAGYRRRQSKKK